MEILNKFLRFWEMPFRCFITMFKENQEIQASLLKILVALSPSFFRISYKSCQPKEPSP